ncbi:MAG: ATP-binding cassette domain-containing protein [Sulfurimonadaceae bacterium]|jgi:molybdate transport system ATP-binding protein|nr:ATP-binding cassette domain-containing protein [Sulfurimonadaceae bacterium]
MIKIDITKKLNTSDGDIDLVVQKELSHREFIALYGKSGSGKTTLLRILAGLEMADSGYIEVDGKVWLDTKKGKNLSIQKRDIGFVFQDYALFANMSVRKNLEFALGVKETKKVDELLELMELNALSSAMPHRLSGGQKQRVALARAIIRSPKLLLLDEPLSALDSAMRVKLQDELKLIHQKFDITSIVVSHDISEIFKLADRVLSIQSGVIKADGVPSEVFCEKEGGFGVVAEVLEVLDGEAKFLVNGEVLKLKTNKTLTVGTKVLVEPKAYEMVGLVDG